MNFTYQMKLLFLQNLTQLSQITVHPSSMETKYILREVEMLMGWNIGMMTVMKKYQLICLTKGKMFLPYMEEIMFMDQEIKIDNGLTYN